jgi:hypothetical protein
MILTIDDLINTDPHRLNNEIHTRVQFHINPWCFAEMQTKVRMSIHSEKWDVISMEIYHKLWITFTNVYYETLD